MVLVFVLWILSNEFVTVVSTSEDLKSGDPRNVTNRNTNVNSTTVSGSQRSWYCCWDRSDNSDSDLSPIGNKNVRSTMLCYSLRVRLWTERYFWRESYAQSLFFSFEFPLPVVWKKRMSYASPTRPTMSFEEVPLYVILWISPSIPLYPLVSLSTSNPLSASRSPIPLVGRLASLLFLRGQVSVSALPLLLLVLLSLLIPRP